MNIEIIKNKNIIKKLSLVSIIFSIIMSLQSIEVSKLFGENTIEALLLTIYGGMNLSEIKKLVPVISWMIPQVLFMYIMGDYISKNLYKNAIYIFTRTEKRYKWILNNIINLFLYCSYYYIVQYLTVIILGLVTGLRILEVNRGIFIIGSSYLLVVLNSFLFVLFINILSLFINEMHSLIVGLSINIGSIFFAGFIYEFSENKVGLITGMPFIQGLYSLHSDPIILQSYKQMNYFHIHNFHISFSYLYILILSILLMSLGVYRICNKDIY